MIAVVTLAFLTRRLFAFNRLAALMTVYVTNPVTTLPIYWFNYEVGTLFVDGHISYEAFSAVLEYHSLPTWWDAVCGLFIRIGAPLIVGSLIVATAVSIPTYPVMLWLVNRFHQAMSGPALPTEPAARDVSPGGTATVPSPSATSVQETVGIRD